MGLDNGWLVKSNKRKLERSMLPAGIIYPFPESYDDYNSDGGIEIVYHRKDWGWRNDIMNTFGWRSTNADQWKFELETPKDVLIMIELTARWLDEKRWEEDGQSVWSYEEVREHLIADIINFSEIYAFMQANPDVYLEFYDSY